MINTIRQKIIQFTESQDEIPIISALASGIYPLCYYYFSNFTLLNSWSQFLYCVFVFLIVPVIVFKLAHIILQKVPQLKFIRKYAFALLNFTWAAFLLVFITFGTKLKIIALACLIAVIAAFFLYKFFKYIVVLQFLMAIVASSLLIKFLVFDVIYPKEWIGQPDNIEKVKLIKTPNIYFIQPDGYANISEMGKGYYDFDNSSFENYLNQHNFKQYEDYRSNYYSTLSSNSSLFGMKHHYYNFPNDKAREVFNSRDVIAGKNPVIDILKRNNYKTFFILEKSYLLANRPEVLYDYCNIGFEEFTKFSRGFHIKKDIEADFKNVFQENKNTHNFYFIEKLTPSHVTNQRSSEDVVKIERDKYFARLEETNVWLKNMIDYIVKNDKNSLIIISADHGGFVGMGSSKESNMKQTDRDLIYSVFTSKLAIKWPDQAPSYDTKFKTPVNLFRILFSYLSEDEKYMDHLQDDSSYLIIRHGAPFGVYEAINGNDELVFNQVLKK